MGRPGKVVETGRMRAGCGRECDVERGQDGANTEEEHKGRMRGHPEFPAWTRPREV